MKSFKVHLNIKSVFK